MLLTLCDPLSHSLHGPGDADRACRPKYLWSRYLTATLSKERFRLLQNRGSVRTYCDGRAKIGLFLYGFVPVLWGAIEATSRPM
jgi:hypothetical protein